MNQDPNAQKYLVDSIRLAMGNVRQRKTWPFGAVIARDGSVIATAVNEVDALCDPTAHAEMQAVAPRRRRSAAPTCRAPRCTRAAIPAPCASPRCTWQA